MATFPQVAHTQQPFTAFPHWDAKSFVDTPESLHWSFDRLFSLSQENCGGVEKLGAVVSHGAGELGGEGEEKQPRIYIRE